MNSQKRTKNLFYEQVNTGERIFQTEGDFNNSYQSVYCVLGI